MIGQSDLVVIFVGISIGTSGGLRRFMSTDPTNMNHHQLLHLHSEVLYEGNYCPTITLAG